MPAFASAPAGLPNPVQSLFERMGLPTTDFAGLSGPLGTTPRETVHVQGTLKLHHYRPICDSVYRTPVLVVTSIVNQPYILDLVPGQSMVESLLQRGYDVYLIEWGRPRREHSVLTLEDLVTDRLPACVDRVLEHSGERSLTMLGYCLGGFLAALYAARPPARQETALRNLICMATPVNSDGLESLKAWMGEGFDEEALLSEHGNVPAEWVQNTLRALRPLGKVAGAMNLLNQIDRQEVVQSNLRMGKWETDNLPFPGGIFRQLVRDFLRANALMRGEFPLGGEPVNLNRIKVPFLHVLAQEDHITPYASSSDLVRLVGSVDKEEIVLKGGHVGLVAGRGAQTRTWPALDTWLSARSS